ncbi:MAG TPA: alpha/beta hydrolase [Acidimicrobiales bacterium]|nr:alpha/beta hydrolase [Acidimicrobiales bacterium]
MSNYVTSRDGTKIAFDRLGEGPPLVLVSGLFCHRPMTQPLAEALAADFTVVHYDRRGRGESGDTAPYAVEREVEDLAALIEEVGGAAAVYGHSSGAGLALEAAARSVAITALVLHEPPYGPDDDEEKERARRLAEDIRTAVSEDRWADAVRLFLAASGVSAEMAEQAAADPGMQAVAHTMPYDFAVMGGRSRGGTIPEDLVRGVDVPTLVLAGTASPDFFRDTAVRLSGLLPNASYTVLEGQDHGAPADVVAPVVAEFVAEAVR